MEISLKPATDADESFLFDLYAGVREAELAQVPWTADQKAAFLRMQFTAQKAGYAGTHPEAVHSIILAGEERVGRLYLDKGAGELHILDITVAPQFRNQGIGSQIMHDILNEAGAGGKKVTIYVETFNPSLRLFERLGFITAAEVGFQFLLERLPGDTTLRTAPQG